MNAALLSEKQVVALCPGVSVHTLRAARRRANIRNVPPFVRVGGRVYYSFESVVAWARANGIALTGPRQYVTFAKEINT